MEFERPEIFNNKNTENMKELNVNKFHNEIQNRPYQELYKPTQPLIYNDDLLKEAIKINKTLNQNNYIGIKNIKSIEKISSFIIQIFYASSFRTKRMKIFKELDEVLMYLESKDNLKTCFIVYKDEIYKKVSQRINDRFIDYIFKMIDINLNEHTRFFK